MFHWYARERYRLELALAALLGGVIGVLVTLALVAFVSLTS